MSRRSLPLVSLSLLTLCTLTALPASAGKPDRTGDRRGEVVGHNQSLRLSPDLQQARQIEGSQRLWTHSIEIAGAAFLRPRFARVDLRPGDVLTVRSGSGRVVEEITLKGPKGRRSFWGLSAFGSELHLEFRFSHDYKQIPFMITDVIVGDPEMLAAVTQTTVPQAPPLKSVCAPADFEDVMCYQGDAAKWSNVLASAGVATANTGAGALWCSGANVSPLNYVLTNQHCIESQADCDNAEFIFKYYRTGCNNGSAPNEDWVSFRCDQVVASSPFGPCDSTLTQLDFALNSVMGDPTTQFGFVTPDPTPLTDGEAIYIVQHPDGRPHEITHGSGADVDVDVNGNVSTLRYYGPLDTEGGSSGSPIFREADDQLVGLHHCGGCSDAGVGNRGMLMSDIYPAIEDFVCQPSLFLASAAAGAPSEVSGNGDMVIDPGETWSFVPRVRNGSCATAATGVEAMFAAGAGSASISLLNTTSTFGAVAATESADGTPIEFTVDAQIPCDGNVIIDMVQVTATGGGPFSGRTNYMQGEIGSIPSTTFFFEDFVAGLPLTWTVEDGGTGTGPAQTWTDEDPEPRNLLNAPYMLVDSDHHGNGQDMDEELISPPIDVTGSTQVILQFEHNFRYYNLGGAEKAEVDVRSSATGGTWVNVHTYPDADSSGQQSFDVTAYAAADLQVRFHYYDANFDWWWAVDDVYLLGNDGRVCSANTDIFEDGFEAGNADAWSLAAP